MINFFKNLFGSKPVETVAEVPYKVEAVVDTADIAIAQLPTSVATQATQAVVESIVKPAAKKPAAKKPAAKKMSKPKAVK